MKKLNSYKLIILLIAAMGVFSSCEKWVNDVDPLEASTEGSNLITEDELKIQLVGLLAQSNSTEEGAGFGHIFYRATLWGDEVQFERGVPGTGSADHLAFTQDTKFDLDFVEGDWNNVHQVRWLADRLIRVTNQIEARDGFRNEGLRQECLWYGNIIGAYTRMLLAEQWCEKKDGPTGAVVTEIEEFEAGEFGSFKTMAQLHADARTMLTAALSFDPGATWGIDEGTNDKVAYSLMARTYLFDGMYAEAKDAAEKGLQEGDSPFHFLSSVQYHNVLYAAFGRGAGNENFGGWNVAAVHPRYLHYIDMDANEGAIVTSIESEDQDPDGISLTNTGYNGAEGRPGHKETERPRASFDNQYERLPVFEWMFESDDDGNAADVTYQWDIYTDRDDNINVIDWREMELILAEVAIRNSDVAGAVEHMNNVRRAHGIDDLTVADVNGYSDEKGGANNAYWPASLDHSHFIGSNANQVDGAMGALIVERDKSLLFKGLRIVDQNRFDLWHLEPDSWTRMPIPLTERIQNPNISMDY